MDDQVENQVRSVVDQLAGWVKNQGVQQKDRSGASGWLVGLGVAVVALAGIALLYWRSWKQGMKLAALQHEKAVNEQKAEMAKIQAQVLGNDAKIEELKAKAAQAETRIKEIDLEAQKVDTEKAKTLHEIDTLKSWRDVDRYLGGGDPPTPTGRAT